MSTAAAWSRRALFLVENLDLEKATGVDGAQWEYFQLDHLNDDGIFRIENKSRQIAWSWIAAAEAVAAAIVDSESSIFVSINKLEADNKITYARAILEALEVSRPKITRDNTQQIQFQNGAELLSLPSKPARGKSRSNLYLDEFAHTQQDREIYTGALPIITKGGRLRIGSSPMGASGMFWEIESESMRQYPGYARVTTPWWHVYAFCNDPIRAIRLAPAMDIHDRVMMFGNERIVAIFENIPIEDFMQEYECTYVDEATAWISWNEIKNLQATTPQAFIASGRGAKLDHLYEQIEYARQSVTSGEIESIFGAGMDIGRTRNTSEIILVGIGKDNRYPLRLLLTLDNVEYDDQIAVAVKVLKTFKLTKFYIDRNGIGSQLAEALEKLYPIIAEGVDFTNASKTAWATQVKMLAQQLRCPIPIDRDLSYQIHSIKKMISPSKKLIFDTARNEKHHADKFWAWVLALDAAMLADRPAPPPPAASFSQRITGV